MQQISRDRFVESARDNWVRRYAAAIIGVAVLTVIRFAVGQHLGDRAPFSIYIIGVAFAAWYGGFGPAVLSLAAGIFLGIYLFASADLFTDQSRLWAFFLVLVTGSMVAALGAARRRAERLASSRKQQLDQVLQQMTDGFVVLNPDGRIAYINDQAAKWFDRTTDRLLNENLWTLLPADVTAALQRAIQSSHSTRLEHPFGSDGRWAELHASPAQRGLSLTISDISQRKAAEQQIARALSSERHAREEAERTNRMKDEFLATLSHELRTPLNAMLGWAQLLTTESPSPADVKQGLSAIERNARAQAQLIEDLLDMSRITAGRLKLDIAAVNLADVVNAALEAAAPAANAKRIALSRSWSNTLPAINGDFVRLQQIVWNLLTNAIKFTPAGGNVRVCLAAHGESLDLAVSDDGDGIDPQFMPQIFGRFQQADGSTTRRHGGLGLGLAIVRHLAELHGGTISAASDGLGKGSTFVLSLPVPRNTDRPASQSDSKLMPRSSLAGLSVLVVDDDADARELATRVLSAAQAEVHAVGSAADAFDAVRQAPPHVLISDIAMPGENGFALISRIRSLPDEQGGGIPAVALTALARPEDASRAIASGFQMHLPKPIDAGRLVRSVATLVGREDGSD